MKHGRRYKCDKVEFSTLTGVGLEAVDSGTRLLIRPYIRPQPALGHVILGRFSFLFNKTKSGFTQIEKNNHVCWNSLSDYILFV